MIISYAQNFEDVMLWRALGHIENGFYIDIGAQDPVVDSVSLAFYEKGWRGVHVEPTPHYAELLRSARPDELVLQAVVSNRCGLATFYEIPETGISTGEPSIVALHKEKGFTVNEIAVPCLTLADIIHKADSKEIQWLKIDVEGMEQQLLEGWGRSAIRPWVVVIESTLPLTQIESYKEWEPIILEKGYVFAYFDGLNRFYVSSGHAELLQSFATPPNVFDDFTFNGGSSNPFCSKLQNDYLCQEKKLRQNVEATQQAYEEYEQKLQLVTGELHGITAEYRKTRQLLAEQEYGTQEKLEALRSELYARSAQAAGQHAAGERALIERIEELHGETRRIEREQAEREQALVSLVSHVQNTTQQRFEEHLIQLAEKERSGQKTLENLRGELNAKSAQVAGQQAASDRALLERIETLHGEMHRLEREQAERERESIADAVALREIVHLRTEQHQKQLAEHKCDAHRQLGAVRSELNANFARAAEHFAFRERQLSERIESLHEVVRNLEQKQAEQVRILQQAAERQKAELLQKHAEHLQYQQLGFDKALELQNQQHEQLLHATDSIKTELGEQLKSKQNMIFLLQQSLEQSQSELQVIHSSLSWHLTAPLRWFTARRVIRTEITRESSSPDSLSIGASNHPDQAPLLPLSQGPVFQAPAGDSRIDNLTQLLALHDQVFIVAAYRTLLGRDPDPEGLAYYLGRLRGGIAKIQLLAQLRFSAEAKEYNACLRGLDAAIKCHRRCRLPIVGRLYRRMYGLSRFQFKTLSALARFRPFNVLSVHLHTLNPFILELESVLEGNTCIERNLRRIENKIVLLRDESSHRFNQIDATIAGLHELALQQTKSIPATMGDMPQEDSDIQRIRTPDADGLKQLSPAARTIYFQLKSVAANHGQRGV